MSRSKKQRIQNRVKWELQKEFNLQSKFKELDLTDEEESLINSALTKLEKNPYTNSAELAKTGGLRRVRVGKYRVIYRLKEHHKRVLVKYIEHRDNLYDSIMERFIHYGTPYYI